MTCDFRRGIRRHRPHGQVAVGRDWQVPDGHGPHGAHPDGPGGEPGVQLAGVGKERRPRTPPRGASILNLAAVGLV